MKQKSQKEFSEEASPTPPVEQMNQGELQVYGTAQAARKLTRTMLHRFIARMILFPKDQILSARLAEFQHELARRQNRDRMILGWFGALTAVVFGITRCNPDKHQSTKLPELAKPSPR